MNMKKLLAGILSLSMLVSATAALAAAPSAYDGQPYPAGVETSDADGQMNLAVIANGDVKIYGDTMYIEGSVYSNGTIYGGNGEGNVIKGAFISGTENQTETGDGGAVAIRYGYVHVDDNGNTDVTNAYSVGLEHEGAILDKNTSFNYSYTPYTYPEIANYVEEQSANQWRAVATISEDTHFGTLSDVSGAGLIIDATEKDITVVIDNLVVGANPFIQVVGDNHVNLYVKNWIQNGGANVNLELAVTDGNYSNWDLVDQWASNSYPIYAMDANGIPRPKQDILEKLNPNQIDLYIDTESGVVNLQGAKIAANIHSNAQTLQIGMSAEIYGTIESGAKDFETVGSGYVNGKVIVPNAASTIHNSSCIQGQLITDTLLINGACAILNQTDSLNISSAPTETDKPSDNKSIHLDIIEDVVYVVIGDGSKPQLTLDKNTNYKWVIDDTSRVWFDSNSAGENQSWPGYFVADDATFDYNKWGSVQPGDEIVVKAVSVDDETVYDTAKLVFVASADDIPKSTPVPTEAPTPKGDEVDLYGLGYAYIFGYEPGAPVDGVTPIYMAPNDSVTREQVASMLMRMIDQKNSTKKVAYPLTANIASHKGTWYERGLAYLASKGTFDGIANVEVGPVTRGEVAKLIAYGLNLSKTSQTPFADVADSQYKAYIEIMYAYGYMEGVSDTAFDPNRVMTRAEFCKLFNNIIGRETMGLKTADGQTVTAGDYSIVDINGHWAYETILKATSAYDKNGYVDFAIRQDNIRNKLDNYDSQMQY